MPASAYAKDTEMLVELNNNQKYGDRKFITTVAFGIVAFQFLTFIFLATMISTTNNITTESHETIKNSIQVTQEIRRIQYNGCNNISYIGTAQTNPSKTDDDHNEHYPLGFNNSSSTQISAKELESKIKSNGTIDI